MNRSYVSHNTVFHYWSINIKTNHPMPENQNNFIVFRGKTLEGAKAAAQRYCNQQNARKSYHSWVDDVLYECDAWGRRL